MTADKLNEEKLMSLIYKYNDEYDGYLSKETLDVPFKSYPHSMILTMFNALAKSRKHEEISNLGGRLFYFTKKTKRQVFCVELSIDGEYIIKLNGRSFTSIEGDNSYGKTQYVLQNNNTMRKRTKEDKEGPFYTLSQFKGTKHDTPFLDVYQPKYMQSRIGVLQNLIDRFNKEYDGLVKLSIKREYDWKKIDIKTSVAKTTEHLRFIKRVLEGRTIRIVNTINDPDYVEQTKKFSEKLKSRIEELFTSDKMLKADRELNFQVEISNKENENDLNIRLIHDSDYYENHEVEDQYMKSGDTVIQNVTLEGFSEENKITEPKKAAIPVVINDLIVKSDLPKTNELQGKISIFDWQSLGYEKDWTFCYCEEEWKNNGSNEKKTKIDHFYFMKIHPDGTFIIGENTKDLFNLEEYEVLQTIFDRNNMSLPKERRNKSTEKYKGLVMNDQGQINIIQDTPFIMYPDMEKINEGIKAGINMRINNLRDKYFLGCLDIYYKELDACAYYSVNQIGAGMTTTISRAANIRRVIPYGTAPIFFYVKQIKENSDFLFYFYVKKDYRELQIHPELLQCTNFIGYTEENTEGKVIKGQVIPEIKKVSGTELRKLLTDMGYNKKSPDREEYYCIKIEKAKSQTYSSEDFAQLKKEMKEAPGNYLLEKYAPI